VFAGGGNSNRAGKNQDPSLRSGRQVMTGYLEVSRKLQDSFLNRPHHQFGLVVDANLPHQIELMRVYGLAAHSENGCRHAHRFSLGQQFQYFSFTHGQSAFWWERSFVGALHVTS